MPSVLAFAPAIIGGISSGLSLFGGDDKNSPMNFAPPTPWQAPGMGDAASYVLNNAGSLGQYNLYGQNLPQYQTTAQNLYANPNAASWQTGAGTAQGIGQGAALGAYGAGMGVYPYAQQLLQTGFDPQNAMRDYLQQKTVDASRVAQSARGIASTPYGAGLENKAVGDFLRNWDYNQLQRMTQAGQGAGGLLSTGAQISNAAAPAYYQASQYPYAAYNQQGLDQFAALNQAGAGGIGAAQIPQQMIEDYLKYLGVGNAATTAGASAANVGVNASNSAFNQQQTLGSQFGQSLYGFNNALKNWQTPTWMSNTFGGSATPSFGNWSTSFSF
jgi:hypothetical protein